MPDYTIEMVGNEQVKKVKVNRPKALCFDYQQLKDMFGLDLETEVITDVQETMVEHDSAEDVNLASDEAMQKEFPF